ncbi:MAG: type III pantothenate kinase [Eubacteriales bacterium]|nr:type III pantothenate kinase [Eubacteriales bacterium]
MIITVNIENTNINISGYRGDEICFLGSTEADNKKTVLDYILLFKSILNYYSVANENIEGGIISSVVPNLTEKIQIAWREISGKEFMILGPGIKTGLSILTDNPAERGNDLVACCTGAVNIMDGPLMVISMGIATSICIINEKNQYIGGMIFPGVGISLDALCEHAAKLNQVRIDVPKHFIGTNTEQALRSGIIYGNASCIDGMVDRAEEELGVKLKVIATGEYASKIIPYCRKNIVIDPNLLSNGLKVIYDRNIILKKGSSHKNTKYRKSDTI